MDATDVGGGVRHFEIPGVVGSETADDVDLLERLLDRRGARHRRGDIDGLELRADVTRLQARDVSVARRCRQPSVGVEVNAPPRLADAAAQFSGAVVVAVDQRRRLQDPRDPGVLERRGDPGAAISSAASNKRETFPFANRNAVVSGSVGRGKQLGDGARQLGTAKGFGEARQRGVERVRVRIAGD